MSKDRFYVELRKKGWFVLDKHREGDRAISNNAHSRKKFAEIEAEKLNGELKTEDVNAQPE